MTDPDVVFAQFVAANPVPDVTDFELDVLAPDVSKILNEEVAGRNMDQAEPAHRWLWAAAMVLLSALAIGALVVARSDEPASQVATEPPSPEDMVGRAVAAAEAWLAALNAGDIERVMLLSGPSAQGEADQRVHEWQAGFAAEGMPVDVQGCDVPSAVGSTTARVECEVRLGDLVAVELGVADLVAPFDYSGGLITWRPYTGGDISDVNDAYSSYLRLFHATEYEARCQPAAYSPGTVIQDSSLALTGECAQLAAPLAADIAQWISDGRPEE